MELELGVSSGSLATSWGSFKAGKEVFEFVRHVLGILEAHARVAAGCGPNDCVEALITASNRGSGDGRLFRNKSGQELVKDDSHGKNIRRHSDVGGVFQDLRCGVARGSEGHVLAANAEE